VIRYIGLSNVSVEQFRAAQRITDIAAVSAHYNVGDRTGASLLAAAEGDGVVFSPWYPSAVAEQGGQSQPIGAVLNPLRDRYQASMPQLAIVWLLHRSPMMLPIPGTSSLQHFRENLAAAAIDMSAEDVWAITQLVRDDAV
jgi:pyridoxine 4-dehydrogenase